MKMSWEYLAGFFDGEGSIHVKSRKHVQCRVVQASFQGNVIYEIEKFLISQKIPCSVNERFSGSTWMLYLSISRTTANFKFLVNLLPYLRVKKQAALGAIDFIQSKWDIDETNWDQPLVRQLIRGEQSKFSKLTERDIIKMRQLWNEGKSGPSIARKFKVSNTTVYDIVYGRAWAHV